MSACGHGHARAQTASRVQAFWSTVSRIASGWRGNVWVAFSNVFGQIARKSCGVDTLPLTHKTGWAALTVFTLLVGNA